jgi:hypothetical protein
MPVPMRFIFSCRVLPSMRIQTFRVNCEPETLRVTRHPSGSGFSVTILDTDHEERAWFASEIIGMSFLRGVA